MHSQRLTGLAGVGFCGLVAVTIGLSVGGPSPGDSAADVTAYFDDPGNRTKLIAAAFLYAAASVGFIGWLTGLHQRLRAAAGERSVLPTFVLSAGIAAIVLELVSAAAQAAWPMALQMFDAAHADTQVALALQGISYASSALAGVAVAAAAGGTAVAVLRDHSLSRAVGRTSAVMAPLALVASVASLAPLVLLIWVATVGVAMARREPVALTAAPLAV
jgi:hypothetical protein